MSKQSQAVIKWRNNSKIRMVESMGGKCFICGYNHCNNALEFHHLNPEEKDFTFGGAKANPKKWETIVNELKKCVLVCANCHREIHAGIIILPSNIESTFNDKYIEYGKSKTLNCCPVCHKLKEAHFKYCSLSCAGKAHTRLDWGKYDLTALKKTMSNIAIANMLGVTETTIRNHLKMA